MSAIALKWVAGIKIGNATAKSLLLFYASHNFGKPGFEFHTKTLSDQLEVSERAIRDAHKFLQEKKLIRRIAQYGKDGSQKSTLTYLEIPDEAVDNFFKTGGGEEPAAAPPGSYCRPRAEPAAAHLNSKYNNNSNKSYIAQKTNRPVDNLSKPFEIRSLVKEWGPGHPDWESLNNPKPKSANG